MSHSAASCRHEGALKPGIDLGAGPQTGFPGKLYSGRVDQTRPGFLGPGTRHYPGQRY